MIWKCHSVLSLKPLTTGSLIAVLKKQKYSQNTNIRPMIIYLILLNSQKIEGNAAQCSLRSPITYQISHCYIEGVERQHRT